MVDKNTIIKDVLNQIPGATRVFLDHGIHCVGWGGALFETVEQGAQMHGVDVNRLLEDLKKLDDANKK